MTEKSELPVLTNKCKYTSSIVIKSSSGKIKSFQKTIPPTYLNF